MSEESFEPTIAAIVTSFNPSDDLIHHVRGLKNHVAHVLVVDDGSTEDPTAILGTLEEEGITVFRLSQNSGIARALNEGIRRARAVWEPEWILTMDQDSTLDDSYTRNALRTAQDGAAIGMRVGLVSPETHNGKPVKVLSGSGMPVQAFDPMQSGCLIPVSVLDDVGLFDESLFIDCVDTDFNLRIRAAGYSTPVGLGCNIKHSLGETRPMRLMGRQVRVGGQDFQILYHSPVRVYYITRNIWVMVRRYFSSNPVWMMRRLWMEIESNLVRLAFGPRRAKFGYAWLIGIRDAVALDLGQIRPRDQARLK